MRRFVALIAVLALVAAAPAPAQAPRPSIPACALGNSDKLVRPF